MVRLIQNLLEISKIEEGKMPLTCEPFAEVVQDVTTEYQTTVFETGKRLVVSVDTAVPAAIADLALLRRVVANLLMNALRHSGCTEVRIEAGAIRLTSRGDGPTVSAVTLPTRQRPHQA